MKKPTFILLSLSLPLITTCAEHESPIEQLVTKMSTFTELPEAITNEKLEAITELNALVDAVDTTSTSGDAVIKIIEGVTLLTNIECKLVENALPDTVNEFFNSEDARQKPKLRRELSDEVAINTLL